MDPAPADPSVAVVVCAYTADRLDQALAAVTEARAQADGPADEVVLVVDHAPELLARVRPLLPVGVAVTANKHPRGLSGARTTGADVTSAELLVYLDDDALPRPGWLSALRRRAADPTVAVVAGAVHPAWEGGSAPAWFPEEFGWVVGCDYRGLPGHGEPVRNPIGACMAVRRDALRRAGDFATALGRVGALPVGCEETLMGIRVRQVLPGALIVRDTDFAVDHHVPRARQTVSYLLSRCLHEGRSKRLVAQAAGTGAALSTERSYVARVLSTGLLRAAGAALRGDAAAPARAGALVAGLVATAAGYLTASRTPAAAAPVAPATADALVSVVVCTLGRDARLLGTVGAVLGQSHSAVELVVVDNDPASGRVAALLAGVEDPRMRVVPQPVPGLSAARNAGLGVATGALVAYTDDDAVPDAQWVERLLAVFRADASGVVACVTGRVLAAETATAEQEWFEAMGIFDKGTAPTVWAVGSPPDASHLGAPGHRTAFFPYTAGEMGSGNNMAFRAAALRALGGFDEALGAGSPAKGGEDLDVFRRVVLGGHVVVYTPDAVVRHFHRDSYDALRRQMFGYGVGMSAVLTKIVLGGGRPALAVLRCLPRGVYTLLAPGSTKNAKTPAETPLALVAVELLGYLAGPFLYLRSRSTARRWRSAVAGPRQPEVRQPAGALPGHVA